MTRNRRLDPEWRQFEQLVARIERDTDRSGLIIRSPDRLRCRITNRSREVDASIRTRDGELITLECRKRRAKADVTWIEQLATKRQSIGAIKTIAVSAQGFSTAAQLLARQHHIQLKTIDELDPSELNPLLGLDLVVFWHRKVALKAVGLREARGDRVEPWPDPDPSKVDAVLPDDVDLVAPIFRNTGEGHLWSVNDIWHQLQEAANPYASLPKMVPPVIRTAWFPYPGNVVVEMPSGPMRLGGVMLTVALWWQSEPVWQSAATLVGYGSRPDNRQHRVEFASEQSPEDWAISLQAPVRARDAGMMKPGGIWPGQRAVADRTARAAPIDLI